MSSLWKTVLAGSFRQRQRTLSMLERAFVRHLFRIFCLIFPNGTHICQFPFIYQVLRLWY